MQITDAMRKAVYREFATRGGHARRDALTPEQRHDIAKKAGQASARARKAKQKGKAA